MSEEVAGWLQANGAHRDVVEWAQSYGADWARAWSECPRGDWMLGIAARRGVPREALVRAAAQCARLALDYGSDDDSRALDAIERAEAFAAGNDEPDARRAAATAVEAAVDDAPDPSVSAAAMAALAAVRAVELPEEAALAAASAAQAAVLDAGDCAMMSALTYAQRTCADRVREHVKLEAP